MSVTLYSQPGCVPCVQTKNWLTKNQIDFETKDVSTDVDAFDEIVSLGFSGTPVIVTDDDSWQGTNIAKLQTLKSDSA